MFYLSLFPVHRLPILSIAIDVSQAKDLHLTEWICHADWPNESIRVGVQFLLPFYIIYFLSKDVIKASAKLEQMPHLSHVQFALFIAKEINTTFTSFNNWQHSFCTYHKCHTCNWPRYIAVIHGIIVFAISPTEWTKCRQDCGHDYFILWVH